MWILPVAGRFQCDSFLAVVRDFGFQRIVHTGCVSDAGIGNHDCGIGVHFDTQSAAASNYHISHLRRIRINEPGFFDSVLPLRVVIVMLLISGYVFAMPLFGFLPASATFLFLSFSYLWRKSVLVSLLLTFFSVVAVYLVFRQLFQVVLPQGTLLQGWF